MTTGERTLFLSAGSDERGRSSSSVTVVVQMDVSVAVGRGHLDGSVVDAAVSEFVVNASRHRLDLFETGSKQNRDPRHHFTPAGVGSGTSSQARSIISRVVSHPTHWSVIDTP